jgi:hypothetical protein
MNTNDERKQLELATSNSPEQNLDAETAELREGWRVLTKTLQQNSGEFNEGALISKFQREMAASPRQAETNGQSRGWMVVAAVLGGALAASLLLMVVLDGGFFNRQPIAKPKTSTPQQKNLAAAPKINPAPVVENGGSTLSWDDPLDSQISVAAAQMQTMQKPALPLDASISTLNYQLQQMAQDLDEGAL